MEFKEQRGEISFEEAERRHAELKRRYDAGQIDEEQFDAERQRLVVVDDEGRSWAISRQSGQWLYHDGAGAWIEATPSAGSLASPGPSPDGERVMLEKVSPQDSPQRAAEHDAHYDAASRRLSEEGPERHCPGCSAPVGSKSTFCVCCGEYLVPGEAGASLVSLTTTPGEEPPAEGPPGHPPEGDAGRRRNAPLLVVLGVAGLVMVLPAVAGLLVYLLWPAEAPTLEVPELEGRTLAAARQQVGGDFELVVSSEEVSGEPKGTILGHEPGPGERWRRGQEVSVVVSSGVERGAVPDVVGMTQQEAEGALGAAGLEVEAQTREGPGEEAGKVVEQSPSGGGDVEEGVAVVVVVQAPPPPDEASGPAPGYNLVQDPTGALTLEAPPSWGVQTGADSEVEVGNAGSWSTVVGYLITSSITTAASLDAWYGGSGQPTAGAYIVASRELAQTYTDDELLYSGPSAILSAVLTEKCGTGPIEDFDRPPYSGKIQSWPCTGGPNSVYIVAAAPEGRECVVVLNLSLPNEGASEADRQAVEHILDTFDADCAGIAGTGSDRIGELATADNEDTPPG